jgi:5-formyltetrahydrofolate cyclo-ligase
MKREKKARARALARKKRQAIPSQVRESVGGRAAAWFLETIPLEANAIVSLYWPLADEFDCRPLLYALSSNHHPIALPLVTGRGRPLDFRIWKPGDPLIKRAFDVFEPHETAEKTQPRVVVTPFLAYNGQGFRLGYGGGYYDRTIRSLRDAGPELVAVGLGYAAQEMPALPCDENDEPLDWLVTERGAKRFER